MGKTHGCRNTRLYGIWQGIKSRCYRRGNESNERNYKMKGIKVCDEWLADFTSFKEWADSNGYNDTLTIDRIDVNGNYEPGNCRWVTNQEQYRNKSNTLYVDIQEEKIPLITYLENIGRIDDYAIVRHRVSRSGWNIEDSLNCPFKMKLHYYYFMKFLEQEFKNKDIGHKIYKTDFAGKYLSDNWNFSNKIASYCLNTYIINWLDENKVKNNKNSFEKVG